MSSEAVERGNRLYDALKEFYDADEHLTREQVLEEVNNYLDDIEKRYDVFMLDLTSLGRDIATMIDDEYFQEYPELFPRPEKCPHDAAARLIMNSDFRDAVGLIHRAIIETAKKR
jgi:hypothetical protein